MKRIRIISVLLVILMFVTTVVYAADSFDLNLETFTREIKQGEIVKISIILDNLNVSGGDKGIGAYQAKLSFDTSVFEFSSVTSDTWEITENEGNIIANTKDGNVVTKKTTTGIIELKVKDDAETGNTIVKLENIEGASPETVAGNGKEITINIISKNTNDDGNNGNNNSNNNSGTENTNNSTSNTNNSTSNVNSITKNDTTISNSKSIPNAGIEERGIAITMFTILIVAVVLFIQYKKYKEIK